MVKFHQHRRFWKTFKKQLIQYWSYSSKQVLLIQRCGYQIKNMALQCILFDHKFRRICVHYTVWKAPWNRIKFETWGFLKLEISVEFEKQKHLLKTIHITGYSILNSAQHVTKYMSKLKKKICYHQVIAIMFSKTVALA